MEISLEGKVALITGASKGIGLAMARSFSEAGAKVMMFARKAEQLTDASASIDGETATFVGNAGDVQAAKACVAATIERFGQLDIMVNNAATNPYAGDTLGVDESRFDKTMQVNLRGPVFWCQAAWEQAFRERPGVILNMASVGGIRTEALLGVYDLTKAALIHLTRQLASELGPTRSVCIAPGLIQTDFSAMLVENFGDALVRRIPTGRLGQPQDVANLATFLVSDLAAWITGDTFIIDGGAGVAMRSI
jgi:NAD(P)-dependent dehydrogenase (short-subunit alcohol dehydrogenase family)